MLDLLYVLFCCVILKMILYLLQTSSHATLGIVVANIMPTRYHTHTVLR